MGHVRDVITCAKFQIEIYMGYDFTGGRIFDFPIDFSMGLTTVQRYCAACDYLFVFFCSFRCVCYDMLVPSYLGSRRIVSLRFLCPEFRYHLTPLGINQSPTAFLRSVWFLLVGGPLARFEVRVSRHRVAPA